MRTAAAFTLVEVIIAITLIGVGITTTVGALTKLNSFASASRNATGAYAAAMNEIDAIQAAAPFNATTIPPVLTPGVHAAQTVTIYQENPPDGPIVSGTRTTTVNTVTVNGVTLHRAIVTVAWRNSGRLNQLTMETLRAFDQ